MAKKETPLMKQYREIKSEYEDSILFFRLGDFYEMFFNDAVVASQELGLTLTSRNKEKGQNIPLAGIPYHSSASYISKLVSKGYKVAICEQTEDPKQAKGIVKREVVKVVTPGTVIDTDYLDEKSNNYLLGVVIAEETAGISYMDITTGEFRTFELTGKNIIFNVINEIHKISPNELLIDENSYEKYNEELSQYIKMNDLAYKLTSLVKGSEEYLKDYFGVISLESYGLLGKHQSISASAVVLDYVLELQKFGDLPVNKISYENMNEYMELNLITQRNLELINNQKEKTNIGTLLWVLDKCKTSMGTRLLKKYIKNPLINIDKIKKRQNDIQHFIDEVLKREELKEKLKDIYDIERLIGKITLGTENGRDLVALKKSIYSVLEIIKILDKHQVFEADKDALIDIYRLIDETIVEEPPFSIREGGIIKRGHNSELDELHKISKSGKDFILEIEASEREKTGIKNMKIKYNKVFGYFLEVTRANSHLVPEEYIRKQTLSNAERYITPELKEIESKILNAKDKIEGIEYELFKEITAKLRKAEKILQDIAQGVSYLDVIIALADVATKNNYICPELTEGFELEIRDARHPIVEQLLDSDEFISNDLKFDEEERVIILTGPNMAGKSTYMKQAALIILMAQMGSFVPAEYAKIGLVDKIFTRVGASDDLVSGQSTFMVEMSEVANIVNNATENSFVILDEVGRGTSTFDGISIASSITEYIHDTLKSKTIFATHYHELTEMEDKLRNVVNFRIEVKETDNEVIFLRKIVRGGADKSYGIEVARLAGLPKKILNKSKKILKHLEEKRAIIEKKMQGEQLALFGGIEIVETEDVEEITPEQKEIIEMLEDLDINNLTPMQALNKLFEIKNKL